MVFGQPVHNIDEFWLELHKQYSNNLIINEEDLPESISEILNSNTEELTNEDSNNSSTILPLPLLSSTSLLTPITENTKQSSHKIIRDEAEKCYIRTAERQLKNYQSNLKKRKTFEINDIVGIKISEVDRTNTSASILPCKIIDILNRNESTCLQYRLATLYGIITNWFTSIDLIDLSETVSADLRLLDTTKLTSVTLIQACQAFTRYKSTNACKCTGSCDTNRCPCKKPSIVCCSKCHRGKCSKCKNVH